MKSLINIRKHFFQTVAFGLPSGREFHSGFLYTATVHHYHPSSVREKSLGIHVQGLVVSKEMSIVSGTF